jgi:hypothetical protein
MVIRIVVSEKIDSWGTQTCHVSYRICLVYIQSQRIARSPDAVGSVVDTLERASLCASLDVGAEVLIEAGGYAVCVALYVVQPAVVGVEDDGRVDGSAAGGFGALVGCEGWVDFRGERTWNLSQR